MFCRVHVRLPEFTQTCEIETRQFVQAMSCQPSHSSACFCVSHITLHCFKVSSCSLASFANIQQRAHVASSSTMGNSHPQVGKWEHHRSKWGFPSFKHHSFITSSPGSARGALGPTLGAGPLARPMVERRPMVDCS